MGLLPINHNSFMNMCQSAKTILIAFEAPVAIAIQAEIQRMFAGNGFIRYLGSKMHQRKL
jgi:hypothetical protein